VGHSGTNIKTDVLVVQQLLADAIGLYGPLRPVTPNGVCGPETIEAITQFQRNAVGMTRPDGRVDPSGKTLTTLVLYATGLPSGPRSAGPAATDVSQAGLKLIGRYEGLVLKLYNDAAGFATIGYGHLVHRGRVGTNASAEAPYVNGLTEAAALALLQQDAAIHVAAVKGAVRVPLTQNQFDALVSLSFNIGAGGMRSSTLVKLINQGNAKDTQIRNAFCMWNKAAGKVNQGLLQRRNSEATVYLDGRY
jgi:GH24 family phage-related lysozyme (muramidase)